MVLLHSDYKIETVGGSENLVSFYKFTRHQVSNGSVLLHYGSVFIRTCCAQYEHTVLIISTHF